MINGSPQNEKEFFDLNPDLIYVPELKALIDYHGIEKAGKIMWAIWLTAHPASGIFDQSRDDKRMWVEQNYLGYKIDWDAPDLADVWRVFPHLTMTIEERMYHDGMMLYEMSVRDARHMDVNKRASFLQKLGNLAKHLESLRMKYVESQGLEEETSGETQSGWASKQKNRAAGEPR